MTGTPTLAVTVGANTRTFSYAPKSYITGSAIFEYTVVSGDADTDGVSVPANSVTVPSGATIKDAAGNNATVTHDALPAQEEHVVDTQGPTITKHQHSGAVPHTRRIRSYRDRATDKTYGVGETITVRIDFSEKFIITGTPTIDVEIGENTRSFSYAFPAPVQAGATNTNGALFQYTVVAGDSDTDGISIEANSVTVPSGASIRDAAGNDAVVTHAALPAQAGHKVSTTVGGL